MTITFQSDTIKGLDDLVEDNVDTTAELKREETEQERKWGLWV